MTRHERHLWYDFLKTYPVPFRRQKQFGRFIVDFYCAKAKLIVEIDGSQHFEPEGQDKDRARDAYISRLGLAVLRFSNDDVDRQFEGVCERIDLTVKHRMDQ